MNVKVNDNVLVIVGRKKSEGGDKGKQGKVIATSPKANTVTVEGVRIQKKHQKARKANDTSKIVEISGPIDVSNVMVVCPACDKATKVKHSLLEGKKVRVCAKCGATLDKAYSKKSAKASAAVEAEAPKKRTRKRAAKPADAAEPKAPEAPEKTEAAPAENE